MLSEYLPVILQILVAGGLAAAMLAMSVLLGKSGTRNATKDSPYECGMLPIGRNWSQVHVRYYLIAILFLIFDVETVFIFPWAITFTTFPKFVFYEMIVFIAVLGAGLAYAWRRGVLEWR